MKSRDMIETMEQAAIYAVAREAVRGVSFDKNAVSMREAVWGMLEEYARSYGEPRKSAADHAKQRREAAKAERLKRDEDQRRRW